MDTEDRQTLAAGIAPLIGAWGDRLPSDRREAAAAAVDDPDPYAVAWAVHWLYSELDVAACSRLVDGDPRHAVGAASPTAAGLHVDREARRVERARTVERAYLTAVSVLRHRVPPPKWAAAQDSERAIRVRLASILGRLTEAEQDRALQWAAERYGSRATP